MIQSEVDILLVEDDTDDLDLALAALIESNLAISIVCARYGEEDLVFIFGRGVYSHRDHTCQPKLVLLDLKLPKADGTEVVRQIRQNPETAGIPVVMLSSSSRKPDIEACYRAGADSYLVKSVNFERFTKEVQQVGEYWLNLNRPA